MRVCVLVLISERGVRRAPDLLPDDYRGSEKDQPCSSFD